MCFAKQSFGRFMRFTLNYSVNASIGQLARRGMSALMIGLLFAATAGAQAKVDRCFPVVVAVDAESTIKAEGKFPKWPVTVVCDRDEIEVTCEKENGSLKVVVPADAAPGVAWLRLYDAKSASNLVPLIVSPVEVTAEIEANNKIDEATKATLPTTLVGRLSKNNEVDSYRIRVESGQRLVASVTAHQVLRSPMDAVLQLVDLKGNVLIQSEDVRGLDPQIVYQVAENTDLVLRIFAFPETPTGTVGFAGSASFVYTIDVTTGPFIDHVWNANKQITVFGENIPAKPATKTRRATDISPETVYAVDSLGWSWLSTREASADRITSADTEIKTLPVLVSGRITEPGEVHTYTFVAKNAGKYHAEVFSKSDGFQVDSQLKVVDKQSGSQLAKKDDVGRNQFDAAIDFTAKQDGQIEVQLSDVVDGFGPRHQYELLIREFKPACRSTVDADHYVLQAGKTIEIPITVNRDRGFNEQVKFTVAGLPKGVTSEPAVSEPKGESAKNVKLKLKAAEGVKFNGPIEISGTVFQLRPMIAVKKIWLTI